MNVLPKLKRKDPSPYAFSFQQILKWWWNFLFLHPNLIIWELMELDGWLVGWFVSWLVQRENRLNKESLWSSRDIFVVLKTAFGNLKLLFLNQILFSIIPTFEETLRCLEATLTISIASPNSNHYVANFVAFSKKFSLFNFWLQP